MVAKQKKNLPKLINKNNSWEYSAVAENNQILLIHIIAKSRFSISLPTKDCSREIHIPHKSGEEWQFGKLVCDCSVALTASGEAGHTAHERMLAQG